MLEYARLTAAYRLVFKALDGIKGALIILKIRIYRSAIATRILESDRSLYAAKC
jgi:hypothetical protein